VDPAGEAGERSEDVPEETPVPDADSADSGVHIGNWSLSSRSLFLLFNSYSILLPFSRILLIILQDPSIISPWSFNFFLPDPSIHSPGSFYSFLRILQFLSPGSFYSFSRSLLFILRDPSILSSPILQFYILFFSTYFLCY